MVRSPVLFPAADWVSEISSMDMEEGKMRADEFEFKFGIELEIEFELAVERWCLKSAIFFWRRFEMISISARKEFPLELPLGTA